MKRALCVFGFLLLASPVRAELLSLDHLVFGAGAITYDTLTGLEWLDINLTTNRSYNDIAGVDGSDERLPGGDFAGFRHAAFGQALRLIQHSGINDGPEENNVPRMSAFLALIGVTSDENGVLISQGVVENHTADLTIPVIDGSHDVVFGGLNLNTQGLIFDPPFTWGKFDDEATSETVGHWLYRESPLNVPEPSTLLLVGLGTLGLLRRRRRPEGAEQKEAHALHR